MKKIIVLLLLISGFISRSQTKDTVYAKLNGSCLLSGGLISVTDYNKIKRLCPPNLIRVIRFKYTLVPKGTSIKKGHPGYVECLGGDIPYLPSAKVGDTVFLDEIVGLNENKKRSAAESIVLKIK